MAIFVSIFLQSILQNLIAGDDPFEFEQYTWKSWFAQIVWWILQASLLAWGLIELYPKL